MESQGRFRLHLPGLLKVLAEHLYSTQRVGIRELIQNAHDSCVRRSIEFPDPGYRPRIDLACDDTTKTLRVADNGCGLTEAEIHEYLTVIGRGVTRELRERLATEDPDAALDLIGQFGVGFLSAFLLASEVVVRTRPVGGGPAILWSSRGDEQFEMREGDRPEPGTTVELTLKPSALFLLHEENLTDVVRSYADFLPIPVHVQGSPAQANLGTPPWKAPEDDVDDACRDYVRGRHGREPLWVLPLANGRVDLGHDTITVPIGGFLFVPPESVASIHEFGDMAVYIRGMAICEGEKDLLPPWARFVRGVIDSPALQPTASREAVHQDDAFETVRRAIEDQLGAGLRRLAWADPSTWRKVVHGHSDVIMSWAVKERDFFRLVAETVPLRTSRGRLALPEYLKATGGAVYYTTRELGSLQEKVLAEGRNVPAIDASWFAVPTFLERYAATHPGVTLVRLDDDPEALIRPSAAGDLAELVALCEELGFSTRVATFKPADLPAVMTYPADAETFRDASKALEEGAIPDGFSGLMRSYAAERFTPEIVAGTLHLNAACPLVRRLATGEIPIARRQAALAVIAHFARLFCGRMLDAAGALDDITAWQRSLDLLVRS